MNLIKPEWKDIAGYEGLYKVSNTGLVRSLNRDIYDACGKWISYRKGCVLIPFYSRKYKCVKLCKGGLEKSVFCSPVSCYDFCTESRQQTRSKSH